MADPPDPSPLSVYTSAIAVAFAGAPLSYALIRWFQFALAPEPDPGAVVWAEHSAQQTRMLVTAYVVVAAIAGSLAIVRRWPAAREQWILGAASLSAVVLAVQALVRP